MPIIVERNPKDMFLPIYSRGYSVKPKSLAFTPGHVITGKGFSDVVLGKIKDLRSDLNSGKIERRLGSAFSKVKEFGDDLVSKSKPIIDKGINIARSELSTAPEIAKESSKLLSDIIKQSRKKINNKLSGRGLSIIENLANKPKRYKNIIV